MGAAEDIATFVAERGFGTIGSTIFANAEDSTAKDPCATFMGAPGEPPEFTQDDEELPSVENPRVRVWCRAKKLSDARALAEQIYPLLHLRNVLLNDRLYGWVQPMSEPYPMGLDENQRRQMVFTVRTKRDN